MGEIIQTSLRGRAIMVVEDEFLQAEDLSQALSGAGASLIGPFATVDAALAGLADGERIDAAVLDVNLRGVAVSPLMEALAARGIPFLFATGYDRTALPAAWRDVPIFEKPFNVRKLVEALAALCASPPGAPPAGGQPAA
jgi:DNA-binding NtrC family response regulator